MDKLNLIKGDDWVIEVNVKNESQSPYNLSSVTAAKACFKNTDNTSSEVTIAGGGIVITNAIEGILTVTIEEAVTALIASGEDLSWELQLDEGGDKNTIQFLESLDIRERLC